MERTRRSMTDLLPPRIPDSSLRVDALIRRGGREPSRDREPSDAEIDAYYRGEPVTVAACAALSGVRVRTVYRRMKDGRLPYVEIAPGQRRIPADHAPFVVY
jgi:hypothetical protein